MKLFNIPTYDQVLCLNGCYLTDSKQTLAELRVFPSSTIYLLNDDSPQNTIEEPVVEGLEEGFKGNIWTLSCYRILSVQKMFAVG